MTTKQSIRRKTKILATTGPAMDSPERIHAMIKKGVDGFRFNFSHGHMRDHQPTLERVRRISEDVGRPVACLADLPGPKIRVGQLQQDPLHLKAGSVVELYPCDREPNDNGSDRTRLPIEYSRLLEDLSDGDCLYINDGRVALEIDHTYSDRLIGAVKEGGTVRSRNGVNIPCVDLQITAFTEQDRAHLEAIVKEDFDFVALSFVRRPEDVQAPRALLDSVDRPIDLVAKIETRQALDNLDDILDRVQGIMVARGDLGVEVGTEKVPFHQKKMTRLANQKGKLVITATQMLESMIEEPLPTRAEVSDVANAVLDGSDVIMLSGETAVGEYPVKTAETTDQIVHATEEDFQQDPQKLVDQVEEPKRTAFAICNAATQVANSKDITAVLAPTLSGFTARIISHARPPCPIIAPSFRRTTRQKTALFHNVIPHAMDQVSSIDRLLSKSVDFALEHGVSERGDRVLLLTGVPLQESGETNLIHVHRIDEA